MIPLRDTIRSRHFPLMTWVILGLNTLVFIYELRLGPVGLNPLVETYALIPARFSAQPLWFVITLFTSMFMHGGWFHFLSNMWMLYIFGDNVEDRMGPLGLLVFYLSGGLVAGLMQTIFTTNSLLPVLGASGAIAAVMGAYILMYPRAKVVTFMPVFIFGWIVEVSALFFIGFWFISQLFSGLASLGTMAGGVAWWAHIGGFLFGVLFFRIFRWRRSPPSRENRTYHSPYTYRY